jgi:hypothetical protein
MHRSGTSAVTRAVNLLGVPTGRPSDLKEPSEHNPSGFWELKPLSGFNEELLRAFGGTWSAPPRMPDDWLEDPRLEPHRARAVGLFRASHTTSSWVWKDPRNCLTLAFWLDVLDVSPVVVLVHRHPLEIWRSLDARDGFSKPLAIALWERYMHAALRATTGLPTVVVRYGDVLEDPSGWCAEAASFLSSAGVELGRAAPGQELEAFLDPRLRHASVPKQDELSEDDASSEQRALFGLIEASVGGHHAFDPGTLPSETSWTEPLLSERRRADMEIEPLRFKAKRLDVDLRIARRRVERLRQRLQERDRAIETRERDLAAARAGLDGIQASASWRLTAPLRRLAKLFGLGRPK